MIRLSVFLLIIGFLSCQSSKQEDSVDSRPNILFILVDDLGKEWVSCYGAEDIETPNIDALAKSGMLFHNVYSMPQCTPTRLTFLTGQYPFRHGWVNHWDVPRWGGGAHFDEGQNPSVATYIREAGYATAIAGKWQIDDFRVEPDALVKAGFDEYCMWTGYETGIPESAERFQDAYIFTKSGSKTYEGSFGPDIFRDFLIQFMQKDRDQPFFAYYPMVLTHPPLVNTPDESADEPIGKHKAMVRYTDKILGEMVAALEAAGKRENTVIIWTTDNGTSRGLVGNYKGQAVDGGKSKTTEPGIASPFIVSWPAKVKPKQSTQALVDFTDLLPTFLDLAGVTVPQKLQLHDVEYPLDGHSFKPSLLNPGQAKGRPWILSMGGGNKAKLTEQGVENQYVFRDRVVRNKQYKLYINTEAQAEKFFDLIADPFETTNLIEELNTEERRSNFEQLSQVITSFPAKDAEPRYHPNPPQEWDVEITAKSQTWKLRK